MDIDLGAPGLRFQLSPHTGRLDTVCMPTLAFMSERKAQMAINAHFFEPWPMTNSDQAANLVGIAASDGQVYSPFEDNPPRPFAIHTNAPGLNLDAHNHATIVHRGSNAFSAAEPVRLWNTVSGNEYIVSNGINIVAHSAWNTNTNPRTAIAIAHGNHLLLVTVDGRQTNVSEGVTVPELADMLIRDYRAQHALLLDGGGSTTLAMDAPVPHIVNVPAEQPPRAVGSSLAIFARPTAVVTNPSSPFWKNPSPATPVLYRRWRYGADAARETGRAPQRGCGPRSVVADAERTQMEGHAPSWPMQNGRNGVRPPNAQTASF
ncbi:MAG: phosphodiester glycosidase family protein [bacterium]|nr:phosphodiester glycosidase family protein [bacterium]